jgi:hypothetical protein
MSMPTCEAAPHTATYTQATRFPDLRPGIPARL